MKQKSKRQKTLKKHQKSKRKIGLLVRMNLWFVQHSTIAWILDASVLLFSALGILYLLYGTTLIPSPYRELHYSFPLYLNIVLLVNASYHTFLRTFRKDWISLRNFAEVFLYPNGIACVLQLKIGITSKRGTRLLPIWALDYRYIWFPLVTYFIFFLVPIVTIIISKYIEKKTGRFTRMKKHKKKSNTKKNLSMRESFQLWLDSHKFLGFFLVLGLFLGIGLGVTLIFKNLPIPSPYRDINYSFPIYINLFCLVYQFFDYWFLDLSRTKMTIKRYADLFIYLNSIGLIVHLFLGVGGKNSKGLLPSLLSLDHRYIWFPILTYVIFFLVATLTILISKNIEKKKSVEK